MRYALYRLTAPILDRIPDISHQPKGRQVSIGLASSLLLHFLLLLLALLFGLILPQHSLIDFAKAKPKLEEIELTIVPPIEYEVPKVEAPPEPEEKKPFIDSTGLAKAAATPDKPVFESDVDMKAASKKAASGDVPLPSQDGRKDRSDPQFTTQKAVVGSPDQPVPAPPMPATPPAELASPLQPEAKPIEAEKAPPTPLKEVSATAPDEVALASKAAEPAPAMPKPKLRANTQLAMLPTATPEPIRKPTYQPEQEETHIDGSISNRGDNAVDAEGTPMGRYKKGIINALGSRWLLYVKPRSFPVGSVVLRFEVDRRGGISNIRVLQNTSNSSFSLICEKAVLDTKLPPPGKGVFDRETGSRFEMTQKFSIYDF
jgi:outer membrane biosynthesis protein TonB